MLQAACTQARKWQCDGLPLLRLAVNLSPPQLRQENLLAAVAEILRAAGCNAYQGPYFSVPLPANAFAELVRRQAAQKQ